MNPITHGLIGWLVAEAGGVDRRGRAWVTFAGLAPDLDGMGIVAEVLTRGWDEPLSWYSDHHRMLCHNGLFCVALAGWALARRRWRLAGLTLLSGHLHLLGDLVGSRGPEGKVWPVPYFLPFSDLELAWQGQWALNGWPNVMITILALSATLWLAWRRGYSPVGLLSERADAAFVGALRGRFGEP